MNDDPPLIQVIDNGTVYMIKNDGPTHGHEVFTILMRDDETGAWERVFGGFSAKRVNGV